MNTDAFIRRKARVSNHAVPVIYVDDSHRPVVTGESGGFETKSGVAIASPMAYSKKGWSNIVYRCEGRKIYVGKRWVNKQIEKLLRTT